MTSPARQQAVSSPLGKGTAEMQEQKQLLNHSNQQFSPLQVGHKMRTHHP